jgi:hypothetical protein
VNDYRGGVLVQGATTRGGLGILVDRSDDSSFFKSNNKLDIFDMKESIGLLIREEGRKDESGRLGTVTVRMKE